MESQPPKPEAFEKGEERLIAARVKALEAIDQKTTCDVATIKVSQTLRQWLPATVTVSAFRPDQKLNVTGYAFDMEDPLFDRSIPIELTSLSSRASQLVKVSEDAET